MKLEPLTLQDLEKIEISQQKHKKVSLVLLLIWTSLAILSYFAISADSFSESWDVYIFFVVSTIYFIYGFLKTIFQLRNEKNKLVGMAKIIEKTDYYDSPYILKFDTEKLKKITVSEEIYGQYSIGEMVYVEVTHRTKELLKIDKIV